MEEVTMKPLAFSQDSFIVMLAGRASGCGKHMREETGLLYLLA